MFSKLFIDFFYINNRFMAAKEKGGERMMPIQWESQYRRMQMMCRESQETMARPSTAYYLKDDSASTVRGMEEAVTSKNRKAVLTQGNRNT